MAERPITLCTRFKEGILFFSTHGGFWTDRDKWPAHDTPLVCICDEHLHPNFPTKTDSCNMSTFLAISGSNTSYVCTTSETTRHEACIALETNMAQLQRLRTCVPFKCAFVTDVEPSLLEKLTFEVECVMEMDDGVSDIAEFSRIIRNLRNFVIDMRTFRSYSFNKDAFIKAATAESRMIYADYVLPPFVENVQGKPQNYISESILLETVNAISNNTHILALIAIIEKEAPSDHSAAILEMIFTCLVHNTL